MFTLFQKPGAFDHCTGFVHRVVGEGNFVAALSKSFTGDTSYAVFNLIRIENGELIIHWSLIGKSDLAEQEWYNTGDLVEVLSTDPIEFRFQSRKNEMINVGGYKVNPTEVEETILNLKGIKTARVYSKSNSVLGEILCAEDSSSVIRAVDGSR